MQGAGEEVVGAAAAVLDVAEPLENVQLGREAVRHRAPRRAQIGFGVFGFKSGFVACAGSESSQNAGPFPRTVS